MASPDPVAALRARYASLGTQLQHNPFERPLVLFSVETPERLQGDIYAVVGYPFGDFAAGLKSPDHWCDMLLLHINTKYCHPVSNGSTDTLRVNIGKKTPEELAATTRVDFNFAVALSTPEYLDIKLSAKDGPMGTGDYRIELEAVALPNGKTFLHLAYSYAMRFAGRLAMTTYLGTLGRDKVGFTVVGQLADGQPGYIDGVRGVVERNTMRYYLAIDSYLEFSHAPPAVQLDKRLQSWFSAAERYPRQLHEIERGPYLEMKRAEYARQQTLQ